MYYRGAEGKLTWIPQLLMKLMFNWIVTYIIGAIIVYDITDMHSFEKVK